jgi:hypothetical protein
MAFVRRARWFVVVAVVMSCCMGGVASLRGLAEAGVIGSHPADGAADARDLAQVQSFLENKIVAQKLVDYGVTPEQALAKVQGMSAQDLHRLASLTERAAVGADGGVGLISLLVVIILILVILKLTNTSVVIR